MDIKKIILLIVPLIALNTTVLATPIEEPPPVCIESLTYSKGGGALDNCFNIGVFVGGSGCKQIIKLRNLSDRSITNTYINMSYGVVIGSCGIDGTDKTGSDCNVTVSESIFNPLGDFSSLQAHTIYVEGAGASIGNPQPDINMTYTENGTLKYGMIDKCVIEDANTADDMCIASTSTIQHGFGICLDFGDFFSGGAALGGCEKQIVLRNISGENLTDVSTQLITNSMFNGSMIDDCGIDGTSGDCTDSNMMDFAFMSMGGMFQGRSIIYDPMPDFAPGEEHYTYTNSKMSMSMFNGSKYLGSYIKKDSNGIPHLYNGELKMCDDITNSLKSKVDVVDPIKYSTYNEKQIIQTKVSKEGDVRLTAVYIDPDTLEEITYTAPTQYGNFSPPLQVLMYRTDSTCTDELPLAMPTVGNPSGEPVIAIIGNNSSHEETNKFTFISTANKITRIKAKYTDWSIIFDGISSASECFQNANWEGNLKGLPQCLNSLESSSSDLSQDLIDKYPNIATVCLNPSLANNEKPCHSSAYNSSGSNGSIVPEKYNHAYGCMACILDAVADVSSCSRDDFAIRPDKFGINMPDSDYPNLLRAGKDYNISLKALRADGSRADDYNVTDHNWVGDLDANTTKYFKDGTEDTIGLLHGTTELNTSVTAYSLRGLSSDSNTTVPSSAEGVIPISYNDVGKINLQVYDKKWAEVDNDDTPQDCDDTHAHTYICGELNVTFIPHHFEVNNIHLRNHRDGGFTYLSNDLNMSAHIDVNISAVNKSGEITQNFRQGGLYYENPVSVDLNITEWKGGVASRHPQGNMMHKHDIPVETLLGFGGTDANGTHLIAWNETNATQQLMFNYARNYNQTVNPFEINGTDINITVQSTYETAIITGTGIGDRNATFVYARAKPNKLFYDDVTSNTITTPISIVAYCDLGLTECQNRGLSILATGMLSDAQSNESNWWYSQNHSTATNNDGQVTLVASGGGTVVPTDSASINTINGIDNNVLVANTGGTPNIVDINFGSNTDKWLIYNKDSVAANPSPFYRVRFIGTSGWTGHGKTGHVVGDDINKKKTRRLEW